MNFGIGRINSLWQRHEFADNNLGVKCFLSCGRVLNDRVHAVQSCNRAIRFSAFLKKWNPTQNRNYVSEKELVKENFIPLDP